MEILNINNDSIDLKLDHTLPEHIKVNMYNIYKQCYLDNASEQDYEPVISEPLQIILKSQDVFSLIVSNQDDCHIMKKINYKK